jgi:hypothetical protein
MIDLGTGIGQKVYQGQQRVQQAQANRAQSNPMATLALQHNAASGAAVQQRMKQQFPGLPGGRKLL